MNTTPSIGLFPLWRATAALAALAWAAPAAAQQSVMIDLAHVGGKIPGVTFIGIDPGDLTGQSVSSAGDVNGDGLADLLIGAYGADPGGDSFAGETYLVYGGGLSGNFDLANADVTFSGIDPSDHAGFSVSTAGDVNGDGLADLLIGAPYAEPRGQYSGETYLIYGDAGLAGSFDLANADVIFSAIDENDQAGSSVSSAGDVNGDGLADLLIGAYGADPASDLFTSTGETYLVYGGANLAANFDLANADVTFRGIAVNGWSGYSVSSAGDVNGDGLSDLLIGAKFADPGGDLSAGETYLVYGDAGLSGSFDLAAADVTFGGIDAFDESGRSVSSAGDVNGDGLADILIGAYAGEEAYLVFGDAALSGSFDLTNADVTFRRIDPGDRTGESVASAGDVNGDGLADLLIGAPGADPGGDNFAGETYLIYGNAALAGSFDLSNADVTFSGNFPADFSGISVSSAGDVNGDGLADILIGAIGGAISADGEAGRTYLIYGEQFIPEPAALALASLAGALIFAVHRRRR